MGASARSPSYPLNESKLTFCLTLISIFELPQNNMYIYY